MLTIVPLSQAGAAPCWEASPQPVIFLVGKESPGVTSSPTSLALWFTSQEPLLWFKPTGTKGIWGSATWNLTVTEKWREVCNRQYLDLALAAILK